MKNSKIVLFLDEIAFNLKQADASFRFYCWALKLKKSKNRISINNGFIYSFHHITNISLFDFITNINKITEKSDIKDMEKHPISFPLLKHHLFKIGNKQQKEKINELSSKILKLKNKISSARNKVTAHSDQGVDKNIVIRRANRNNIRTLLDDLMELLNTYFDIYQCNLNRYFFDDNIDKELLNIYFNLKEDNNKTRGRFERYKYYKIINPDLK